MKYIIFEDRFVVIFLGTVNHSDMARKFPMKTPVSAGSVHLHEGDLSVGGDSHTLKLASRPEDKELIERQLNYY